MIEPPAPIRVLAFMEAYVVNGAAKSLLNFCDAVQSAPDGRIEIAIATFYRGKVSLSDTPNEFVAAARQRGIKTFVIAERSAFDPGVLIAMRRVARTYAPDVIATNNVKSHFLVRLAGLNRNRTWTAIHHGYTATDSKIKFFNTLDRFSLPAADRVVLVCEAFRNQLAANHVHVSRVSVIHNSADVVPELPERRRIRDLFQIEEGTKVFLTIGRLSFEKGHADLIDALHMFKKARPHVRWKLLVVGSGPELEPLQERVRQAALGDEVIFAGQQTDVLPYFAASDAMLLPSHTEGSPHVVLEAMAAGVPVIASSVGGVPEILSDDIAQLVPSQNPASFANAITQLVDDPQAAQARAAKAKIILERDFSHAAYRTKMLDLFESVRRRSA